MEIAELERALQQSWDRDHLAVYGDYLQAQGDPRGELIAIDLAGAPEHLAARRAHLVRAWLGALSPRIHVETQFGFVTALHVTDPDGLARLATPYVRGITIEGTAEVVAAGVASLGARPRPWLERLVLRHDDTPPAPIITRAHAAALNAATPHLAHLEVAGRCVFDATFVHPTSHRLTISGYDALGSLSGDGPALASVTKLDFAIYGNARGAEPDAELLHALLPPERLPALRELDLSRNEPRRYQTPALDLFAWLRALRLRELTHLRLPSLRTEGQVNDLAAAIARMPGTRIAIARSYGAGRTGASPAPPAGVLAPPARPWPPPDQVSSRDALSIKIPGEPYGEDVDVSAAVELMELDFDAMPADCRAAWTEFWDFLDDLGWEGTDGNDIVMELPAIILLRALDPVDLTDAHMWLALREVLRRRAASLPDTVSIKRYWGW